MQLNPSDLAPDFTLPTADGRQASLADLRQRAESGVVMYFYPKAATPGCTTQANEFRDNLASLTGAGYEVIGVSTDSISDLQTFAEDEGLNFPLASDADHAVAEAYGVWGTLTFSGTSFEGVRRSTFVVNPDGTLRLSRYDVSAEGSVAALREELGI